MKKFSSNKFSSNKLKVQAKKDKNTLLDLYAKTAQKSTLKKQVVDVIPDEIKEHIIDCFMHQTLLTLVVENQLIASKIRYILPQLKGKLQSHDEFKILRKIRLQIKVSKLKEKILIDKGPKPQYSIASSSLLNELAESIGDQELQNALIKLAKHVKEKKVLND